MNRSKRRRPRRDGQIAQKNESSEHPASTTLAGTGAEVSYLRSLIDTRTIVTVVLNSGSKFRGRVRYFDRDCLSLGLSDRRLNIFLRKSSVRYIYEG